jgi:hypothetical protein
LLFTTVGEPKGLPAAQPFKSPLSKDVIKSATATLAEHSTPSAKTTPTKRILLFIRTTPEKVQILKSKQLPKWPAQGDSHA